MARVLLDGLEEQPPSPCVAILTYVVRRGRLFEFLLGALAKKPLRKKRVARTLDRTFRAPAEDEAVAARQTPGNLSLFG